MWKSSKIIASQIFQNIWRVHDVEKQYFKNRKELEREIGGFKKMGLNSKKESMFALCTVEQFSKAGKLLHCFDLTLTFLYF